jgi:hypothetical protein
LNLPRTAARPWRASGRSVLNRSTQQPLLLRGWQTTLEWQDQNNRHNRCDLIPVAEV